MLVIFASFGSFDLKTGYAFDEPRMIDRVREDFVVLSK